MKPIDIIKEIVAISNQPWLVAVENDQPNWFVLTDADGNIFAGIMSQQYTDNIRTIASTQLVCINGWYAWVMGEDSGDYYTPPNQYDIEVGYYQRIENAARELVLYLIRGMIDNKIEVMF